MRGVTDIIHIPYLTALKSFLLMFLTINPHLMFPLLCLYLNEDKCCSETLSLVKVQQVLLAVTSPCALLLQQTYCGP